MRTVPAVDVTDLPDYDHGTKSSMWWGTLAFCAIEATGFALAIGSTLYLAVLNPAWPPSNPPPDLLWGTLVTIVLVASAVPNMWLDKAGHAEDRRKVQIGLVIMSVAGILPLIFRFFEFGALNVRWDDNAYGSVQWLNLGLHATHLITDLGDTLVLTALMFTRNGRGKRFSDVTDNCFYWNFVILSWLPIYVVVYWLPRF